MEVRLRNTRTQGNCYVTFTLVMNDTEKDKVNKFGAPTIELGGTFTTFTLAANSKKLSEFPFTQRFDGTELGHTVAEQRAVEFTIEIKRRLQIVWDAFKAIQDAHSGETVYTI